MLEDGLKENILFPFVLMAMKHCLNDLTVPFLLTHMFILCIFIFRCSVRQPNH